MAGARSDPYILSGTKVIAEYDNGAAPGSPTREYIYSGSALLAKIESGATKYYHQDHLSNRVVTDSSGNLSAQMGTYPFGESWYNSTSDKLLFTTYERDSESGNDYAMARFYVNRLGRFSSPDPLSGSIGDPQSLNRYPYVRNDPIDFTDPLGLTCYTYGFWELWGDPDTGAIWYTVWDPTFTVCDPKQGGGRGGGAGKGFPCFKDFLKNMSKDCSDALTKLGVMNKLADLADTAPIFDVNPIADEPATSFWGSAGGPKVGPSQPLGAVFDQKTPKGGALTVVRVPQPGIYARDPGSVFQGENGMYLLLHEMTHLAVPGKGYDLDQYVAPKLGLSLRDGESWSDAVSRYFNAHCDPAQKGAKP